MKKIPALALLLSCLLLSACDAVLSPQPMGEEVVVLDMALWQGTWASGEIVLVTTVLDEQQGLLEAAWVERGDQGATFESVRGIVRETGEWVFLSMEHQQFQEDPVAAPGGSAASPNPVATGEYQWARVDNNGQRMLVWWPDAAQFRDAVTAGMLPGVIKPNDDILLGPLEEVHLERINSPQGGLLNWASPVVFVRIGN